MDPSQQLIFVSIASYRDAQLVPTVEDLLAKATQPERLRIGICWQHSAEDPPLPFQDDPRLRILDVDWRASRGACWARAEIMKRWQGEPWFLQTDSHCRFATGWDRRMIEMAAGLIQSGTSAKPILSTYAAPFTPATVPTAKERLAGDPQSMAVQTFTDDGIPQLKPLGIPNWRKRTRPLHARFLSAGFLFTPGSFVEEVPYDPDLYFFGEEVSMTLRAYTNGYDLFHPHENLVWHDYVRAYATRHWEDHAEVEAAAPVRTQEKAKTQDWKHLDTRSREKVTRQLAGELSEEDTRFGLGHVRTLADYEAYAGISFRLRKVQDYTRRAAEPPNPPLPPNWPERIYTWLVRVVVDPALLPKGALDEPLFWYVAIFDEEANEILRRDFPRKELEAVSGTEPQIVLVCEVQSGIVPTSWTVWPVDRNGVWLRKLAGKLADDDFSVILEEEDEAAPTESAQTRQTLPVKRPLFAPQTAKPKGRTPLEKQRSPPK